MLRQLVTKRKAGGATVMLVLLLVAAGCGGTTASVSGKVSYKGTPLNAGAVVFHAANGHVDSGAIGADGRYTVGQLPVGTVKVAVLSAPFVGESANAPKSKEVTKDAKDPKTDVKFVPIPPKYAKPDTSGLAYTLTSGAQTINIELTP